MKSNEKNYFVVDVGGTFLKYAVLNQFGEIKEKDIIDTPQKSLASLIHIIEYAHNSLRSKYDFSGVALSMPGGVDSSSGIIHGTSSLPYIHGPNIKELLKEKLKMSVHLENDANCAALAEVWQGRAQEVDDVLFIIIGTGIGGAVVKNKKLHKGKNLQAGEFGLMLVQNEYNEKAIWSEVASTRELVNRSGCKNGYSALKEYWHDEEVKKTVDEWARNIVNGIYNLQHSYDPERIIIGGGISANLLLPDLLNEQMDELLNSIEHETVRPNICIAEFKNDANLIGALYHFLSEEARCLS